MLHEDKKLFTEIVVTLVRFQFSENPSQNITSKIRHSHDLYFFSNHHKCANINSSDKKYC